MNGKLLTFSVFNDLGVVGLHKSNAGVSGAQINSDNAIYRNGIRGTQDMTYANCLWTDWMI